MDLTQRIALDSLENREKSILHLYFFCGYKEREIAKYYNVNQQRISRIKRWPWKNAGCVWHRKKIARLVRPDRDSGDVILLNHRNI